MNENEQHIYHYCLVRLNKKITFQKLGFLRLDLKTPEEYFHRNVFKNRIFGLVFEYKIIVHHHKY